MLRWLVVAVVLLVAPGLSSLARGATTEEPLWSEGAARAALPPAAPINMQSFIRLARTLGPAVVNVVAIQSGEAEATAVGNDKPHGHGRGQGTGFVIHKSGYVLTNSHV